MENENLKPIEKLTPFTKMIMTIGALPSSFYSSMSYYESMVWLYEYLKNQVIPTVNNNAEAVEELQAKFIELKTYIDEYFDNLDVQEEINNKLDEMALDGTLTNLIKNYIDPLFNEYKTETNNDLTAFKNDIQDEIDNFEDSVDGDISSIQNTVSTQNSNISVLSQRMDSFTNLTEGSTTGDAELIDGRTSYSGIEYPNIGGAIRGQTDILLSKINNNQEGMYRFNAFDGIYQQGLFSTVDGTYNSSRTDYICTKNKILTNGGKYYHIPYIPSGITALYVAYYQEDDTYIDSLYYDVNAKYITKMPANVGYIRVSMTRATGTPTSDYEFDPFVIYIDNLLNSFNILKTSANINDTPLYEFNHCIYYNNDGRFDIAMYRLGLIKQLQFNENKIITVDNGYSFSYTTFSQKTEYPNHDYQLTTSGWLTSPTVIPKGTIFTINFRKNDDHDIDYNEILHLHINTYFENLTLTSNYAIDSSMYKKNITLTKLGTVSGYQSFCMYDSKIYTYAEGNMYIYDNSYNLLNTISIDLGHGNSLQLGHDGYAYASGWDDNKVYKVNLTTTSIDEVINLPTTGYTTVAVDDINKIMYIFQRDSYPTTNEYYNFIKYDYDNEVIISTQKTYNKFSAMQSCDFIEGKIYVQNGFGSANNPNYFKYYNTNGDVIGEYVIGFSNEKEPEGIFIDRNTKDIYIQFSHDIYKINQLNY